MEEKDLMVVDGIKLIVGKKYLVKYAHGPQEHNGWEEHEITRITTHGHPWAVSLSGTKNGILTDGNYFIQEIPYSTAGLSIALGDLQKNVFGLFKLRGTDFLEMVIRKDGDLLKTVTVGRLGGLSTTHIPMDKGVYKEFGEGRSLDDMLRNPFELQDICKSFDIK